LGYDVWHATGSADYGPLFKGTGREFIDWVCEQHRRLLTHSHQISNILTIVSGDAASSEAYVTAALRYKDGDRLIHVDVRGRYLDRWSLRSGVWAIDERQYVHDFDDRREVVALQAEGWSSRDTSDPSYQLNGF
jgi:hypothetical protein